MNNARRKQIDKLIERLYTLQEELQDLSAQACFIADDERDAFDNLPESIQESERGEKMEESIDNLEDASNELDYIDLSEIISRLEDAKA